MSSYHEIGANLLPAIAYGDAAGLPYEAKPAREPLSIDGLHDVTENTFIGEYPAGTWSDDTHLSIAVAKSLIDARGFDLKSQAVWHVAAYRHVQGETNDLDMVPPVVTDKEHSGWGNSTTSSVERLIEGVPPADSGHPEGAGNGVLMKMAPLVWWQVARGVGVRESEQQIIELTNMTHNTPVARVASLVHMRTLRRLFSTPLEPRTVLERAYYDAVTYEHALGTVSDVSKAMGRLLVDDFFESPTREKVLTFATEKGFYGFYAPETLAMVYGSFVLESRLPEAVFRAVELGGDSDSTGSMIAAMAIAANPSVGDKLPGRDKIFDLSRLQKISGELAEAAA